MTQAEKEAVLSLRQQHYSFSAIAETTGLPLGTIKSFLSRVGEKNESPSPASAQRVTLNHTCCRQCGAPLDQTQRGKARTFCSDRCRAGIPSTPIIPGVMKLIASQEHNLDHYRLRSDYRVFLHETWENRVKIHVSGSESCKNTWFATGRDKKNRPSGLLSGST